MSEPKKLTPQEQEIRDLREAIKSHETIIKRRQDAITEIKKRIAELEK